MKKPTVATLFAGGGGDSLGFTSAGFELVFANDNNPDACETLRTRFENGSGKKIVHKGNVEKISDNFASSPGSGHFGEMGIRKSQMQTQATQILTSMNTILKSVIQLLYDLREFKIRLSHYDAAKSQDPHKKQAAILALKQIWMDKVDMGARGGGSINQLSAGCVCQDKTCRTLMPELNNILLLTFIK